MPSNRKILINSPILNELVFDYLFTLSEGDIKKLAPKEIRAIRTAKQARHFVSRSTLDEKLLLLAKLGVQFSFMLHQNNPIAPKHIKELAEKYKEMSKREILRDLSAEKFVVVTDRVLINFINVMGHYTHSDTYLLNLDFHRVGVYLNKWKKEKEKPNIDSIQESLEFARVINKLLFNHTLAMKGIRGETQIGDLDFNILMMLYDTKTVYVPRETIEYRFEGMYKKNIIAGAIKRLVEKVLIERNPTKRESEYQITSLGSSSVMDFHKKTLNKTV